MIHPVVYNTSKVFSEKGVRRVVLSPGSRNAPLTISFARNTDIKIYNIVDERSAGFIALGMAQQLNEPVVLCCTSGTSLLNYTPAIAEAWYQGIPLIVLSADRPPEWQEQRDGQTIQQPGTLQHFVQKTFQLPVHYTTPDEEWEYSRKLNEAINLAQLNKRPVHINVPFSEPFYPSEDQTLNFSANTHIITAIAAPKNPDLQQVLDHWSQKNKRLVICGQQRLDQQLNKVLKNLEKQAVIVSDIISNTPGPFIRHQDLFLSGASSELLESLQPELIISFGKSVISKSLKLFLRKYPAIIHWHFDEEMVHADPFQIMTGIIESNPLAFFEQVTHKEEVLEDFRSQLRDNFIQNWKVEDKQTNRSLLKALKQVEFSEFKAFRMVMEALPGKIDLHLANSMPVRFANFIQGLSPKTEVFCNRGTSGIDGTNGTAVGNVLASEQVTVLLTGDLSFFYDRNAFFHQYDLSRLKIIVFNNCGGGIFRLIGGPSQLPELEQHFETRHHHSAKFTALEYGFDYFKADSEMTLESALNKMFEQNNTPKLIEIFTTPETNKRVYQEVKEAIRKPSV